MKPTIRTLQLLGLSALAALGCASSSTVAEQKPTAIPTQAARDMSQPSPLGPVYFETDQAVLRADARATLEARARAIRQHPEWGVVTIQGHCDERGSEEYNLALGERRAMAVEHYLVNLGVPASRLETVSYGESRPAASGRVEAAWRQNRRSEFAPETVQSANR